MSPFFSLSPGTTYSPRARLEEHLYCIPEAIRIHVKVPHLFLSLEERVAPLSKVAPVRLLHDGGHPSSTPLPPAARDSGRARARGRRHLLPDLRCLRHHACPAHPSALQTPPPAPQSSPGALSFLPDPQETHTLPQPDSHQSHRARPLHPHRHGARQGATLHPRRTP